MTVYYVEGIALAPDHPQWLQTLARAHQQGVHPLCGCIAGAAKPALYIAKYRLGYYVKRMPFTASHHAPRCEHYEPPMALSGLGHVHGSAIKEDPKTDFTVLNLDYALTKGAARGPVVHEDTENESARADGAKLTLRGTLHHLYDKAGLSQWYPAMAGKRTWFIVRRELMKAAAGCKAKGLALNDLLFVPESFSLPHAQEIADRRVKQLARLNGDSKNKMLVIGEVKSIEPGYNGLRVTFKHLATDAFRLAPELHKRMQKLFAPQLAMCAELENTHLLLIGVFSKLTSGIYDLESVCLMNVNQHWMPFDSQYAYQLLTALHHAERPFRKSLRYNLKSSIPLATATLLDTGEHPTALYAHTSAQREAHAADAAALLADNKIPAWFWETDTEALPALPAASSRSPLRPAAAGPAPGAPPLASR